MSIVLFALIGARLGMGTAYWICYGAFCFFKVFDAAYKAVRDK